MTQDLATALGRLEGNLTSHGHVFDSGPDALGELRDSSGLTGSMNSLRERVAESGYLLLRRYLDPELVLAARAELCQKLDSVGLIDRSYPISAAIFSGESAQLGSMDRRTFARELRSGPALRAVCHGQQVLGFFQQYLGGEVLPYSYIWVRNMRAGAASGVHFDWVYMGRGTRDVYTTWAPMGHIALPDGPLAILEGSHQIEELRDTYGGLDADRDGVLGNPDHKYANGWLTKDVTSVQANSGRRWLTAEFEPGDLVIFGMFTLHCSMDNRSPENRIRLSTDSRYQLASEPSDERWVGDEAFGEGMG